MPVGSGLRKKGRSRATKARVRALAGRLARAKIIASRRSRPYTRKRRSRLGFSRRTAREFRRKLQGVIRPAQIINVKWVSAMQGTWQTATSQAALVNLLAAPSSVKLNDVYDPCSDIAGVWSNQTASMTRFMSSMYYYYKVLGSTVRMTIRQIKPITVTQKCPAFMVGYQVLQGTSTKSLTGWEQVSSVPHTGRKLFKPDANGVGKATLKYRFNAADFKQNGNDDDTVAGSAASPSTAIHFIPWMQVASKTNWPVDFDYEVDFYVQYRVKYFGPKDLTGLTGNMEIDQA